MNTEINESWERLHELIAWSGLTVREFALQLGYPRPETLYRIKHGKNGISRTLAERILAKYPAIRKCWLLCGEGSMLHEKTNLEHARRAIVFYCNTTLRS